MKKKELKDRAALLEIELAALRDQMQILVMKPDSPEAAVVVAQWMFAKEIERSYNSGNPIDTPKLLGLYGKMMNPMPEKLKNIPQDADELKKILGAFYWWVLFSNVMKHTDGSVDPLRPEILEELLSQFIDKLKEGEFG